MKDGYIIRVLSYLTLGLFTVIALVPFILMIVISFTDDNWIVANSYTFLPEKLSLTAYEYIAAQAGQFTRAYGITIFTTAVGTMGALFLTTSYAYVISRADFPLAKFFTVALIISILFNGGLVPTYLMYVNWLHIKNTLWALLLPNLLLNGFNVIIVRTYFKTSIPSAILEAARIDGAGEFRIFFKIILPLSLPILATVGLLIGVSYWNDWNNGLIYLTEAKLFSIQNLLNRILLSIQFLRQNSSLDATLSIANLPNNTIRMAIAVVGILPILIIYPFFQKFFAKGLVVGAVKG